MAHKLSTFGHLPLCGCVLMIFLLTSCEHTRYEVRKLKPLTTAVERQDNEREKQLLARYKQMKQLLEAADAMPENEQLQFRNATVLDLMWLVDNDYNRFKKQLYVGRSGVDFVTDVIVLGLNAAAAATGETEVKTILAIASGGVVGTRAALDARLFRDKTTEVLVSKMNSLRDPIKVDILGNLKTSLTNYPVRVALGDVQRYSDAGSIVAAVVSLSGDVKPKEEAAKKLLQSALTAPKSLETLLSDLDKLPADERNAAVERFSTIFTDSNFKKAYEDGKKANLSPYQAFISAKQAYLSDARNKTPGEKNFVEALNSVLSK